MSQGIMRRIRYGDTLRSRRSRPAQELERLAASGKSILSIELEGTVFFASAEQLQNRVDDAVSSGSTYVIVDLERVTEIDSTGAQLLVQMVKQLASRHAVLVLSGLSAHERLASSLREQGVIDAIEAIDRERIQPDLDRALEWCETAYLGSNESGDRRDLEHADLLRGLDADAREVVVSRMQVQNFAAGQVVFAEGDEGSALYVIAHGTASVRMALPTGDRRLVTFSAGTVFGEMALLDHQKRSATVRADEELTCYVLDRPQFDALAVSHPAIAITIMANLAREMSQRLRIANRAHAEATL
jgi:anti-anti-sigma factor